MTLREEEMIEGKVQKALRLREIIKKNEGRIELVCLTKNKTLPRNNYNGTLSLLDKEHQNDYLIEIEGEALTFSINDVICLVPSGVIVTALAIKIKITPQTK